MKITLKESQMTDEEKEAERLKLEEEKKAKEEADQSTKVDDKVDEPTEPSMADQLKFYKEAAERQAVMIQNLTNKVEETNKKIDESNKPAGKTKDELNAAFVADPVGTLTDIMRETVAPLYEFRDEVRAVSAVDKMKNQLKADPRYKRVFDVAEAHIDAAIAEQSRGGGKVSLDVIKGLTMGVAGAIQLGEIEIPGVSLDNGSSRNTSDSSTNKGKEMNLPPHLRPSAPPAPKKETGVAQLRELSELEERLRREQNLSKEDFLALIDLRPDEVVTSKIAGAK